METDKKSIRQRALELIAVDGHRVGTRLARASGLSRQAANGHLQSLVRDGLVNAEGTTLARAYRLETLQVERRYPREGLQEDLVWRELISPILARLGQNVRDIWHYAATEMINKIQRALGLHDLRDAILELAKGKLTTAPEQHSGEGIFFTSRALDHFEIESHLLRFSHAPLAGDVIAEQVIGTPGTRVRMRLANDSPRILRSVFDAYTDPDEYSFDKTVVPLRLAQYEGEKLVSRSQAKRVAQRFERFKRVELDFAGVADIGQAFADELFRVFAAAHPATKITAVNAAPAVAQMIRRAVAAGSAKSPDGKPA